MKLGIGIDTGGTYTDAVLYDFENKKILNTAKSLTTKNDLSIGILGALDALPADLLKKAELISLSTTLATNACVEDKGGCAKLIFFGGDPKVIDEYGSQYGLPPSSELHIQESFTSFSGEATREPDWALFESALEHGYEQLDGVGIIEMNAMRNGASVEKKAKALFLQKHDIPVVCGHELFSELNCLQRGSSTLLNAGLFPVIKEFLTAVKKALAVRGLDAALVIIRSDGSMMSEEFASLRPVETLLCGPAASAIGGTQLTDNPNSIIVDMGGTTTDIALVKDGLPVTVVGGVSIGKWKTFVDGLYVKTLGLGGDTAIHYNGKSLKLKDYRIVPLCVAAQAYPAMLDSLKTLKVRKHSRFLYEHYMLVRDINASDRYTGEEKALCAALRENPLPITEAAAALGKDIYSLNADRLIKDGAVQICGLTPTDIMHIKGDFDSYCTEASVLAATFVACNLDISVDELCTLVYDEVKRKLYLNIVKVMLENKYADYAKNGVTPDVERFINDQYEAAKAGGSDPLLSALLKTDYSLVGIGAPIHIFLDDVAKLLGTHAVIPKHYEVANALGAIMGSISATHSVDIRPNSGAESITGYTVYGNDGSVFFEQMADAEQYAVSEAKKGARAEAIRRGAVGRLTVTTNIAQNEAELSECMIYLGTRVTAHAVGVIGFFDGEPACDEPENDEQAPVSAEAVATPKSTHPVYHTEERVQEALSFGFSQAGELNISALVFMPEVKAMCAACEQYGKNWRCPPGCGSVEDAAKLTANYSYGIIVQTIGHMEDDFDGETVQRTGEQHGQNFRRLIEKVKEEHPDILPMGAGTCKLCKTCSYPDAPCRFPDKAISSMEAYGLWVSRVCSLSGIPYNNGKSTITYTSCYLLK